MRPVLRVDAGDDLGSHHVDLENLAESCRSAKAVVSSGWTVLNQEIGSGNSAVQEQQPS